ncbi:MAG: ribbon-helix-helix protein, CopG family [Deltaproteobacteria bacterium]|nr:ribbon-helix-helix protein, CopG family [Deltaproteobacteria bacterium]
MRETITISLPAGLRRRLDKLTRQESLNRSDVVREALRQYFARREFQRLRASLVPEAEKRGLYTDEDVFRQVS